MERFVILLHSLPQELYDHIYEEVFTAPKCRIYVGRSYTAPHLLAVNSTSRHDFAKSYYQNTLFVVDNDIDLHRWLRSIAFSGYLPLIGEVRYLNRSLLDPCVSRLQAPMDSSHSYRRIAAEQHGAHMLARLKRNIIQDRLELSELALKLEQHFLNDIGGEDVIVCSGQAKNYPS